MIQLLRQGLTEFACLTCGLFPENGSGTSALHLFDARQSLGWSKHAPQGRHGMEANVVIVDHLKQHGRDIF